MDTKFKRYKGTAFLFSIFRHRRIRPWRTAFQYFSISGLSPRPQRACPVGTQDPAPQHQTHSHSPQSTLHTPLSTQSGQAMIEVMVGLIALLVLVAGMLQVASLTKAQTDTMVEAREDAGRRAFGYSPLSESPDYIRDIEVGPDGRTYSLDDTTTRASGALFHDTITAKTVSDQNQWNILDELPDQSFPTLNNAGTPISTFGLLKGNASSSITLRPAVRSLIYRAEEIEIESDVWMTWTRGIY